MRKLLMKILGKKLTCKYIEKKHQYDYRSTYLAGERPYYRKVHINSCANCGSIKKVVT